MDLWVFRITRLFQIVKKMLNNKKPTVAILKKLTSSPSHSLNHNRHNHQHPRPSLSLSLEEHEKNLRKFIAKFDVSFSKFMQIQMNFSTFVPTKTWPWPNAKAQTLILILLSNNNSTQPVFRELLSFSPQFLIVLFVLWAFGRPKIVRCYGK